MPLHELRLYSFIHLTILASLVFNCAGFPAILRSIFSRVFLCALRAISPGVKEWKKLLTCRYELCVVMSAYCNLSRFLYVWNATTTGSKSKTELL